MSAPVLSSLLSSYRPVACVIIDRWLRAHPGSHIYVGLRGGGGGVYHIINLSTLILFAPTFILISLSQASFVASLKQHIVLVSQLSDLSEGSTPTSPVIQQAPYKPPTKRSTVTPTVPAIASTSTFRQKTTMRGSHYNVRCPSGFKPVDVVSKKGKRQKQATKKVTPKTKKVPKVWVWESSDSDFA